MTTFTFANLANRLKLTVDELKHVSKEKLDELCVKLPWIKDYLNKSVVTSGDIEVPVVTANDIILAKVGINALIDEATGYQEVRKPDALVEIAKELSEPDISTTSIEQYQSVVDEPKVTEPPVIQVSSLTKKAKRKYNFKQKEGTTK